MAKKEPSPSKMANKASAKYSPKPMGLYEQGQTSRAAAKKQADKVTAKRLKSTSYAPSAMTDKQKKDAALKGAKKQAGISIKKDAKKIAGVAGKVAGKAVGAAKSKVKADIKAAKTVAGFAAKTAMSPVTGAKTVARFVAKQAMPPSSNPILKGAKAAGKAIAGDPLKNLIKAKKAKKK